MRVLAELRLPPELVAAGLARGGRVVVFDCCISFLVITLRLSSTPRLYSDGRRPWLRGVPFSCVSLLLGWWGFPWGLILTPTTILTNLSGGRELTDLVRRELSEATAQS